MTNAILAGIAYGNRATDLIMPDGSQPSPNPLDTDLSSAGGYAEVLVAMGATAGVAVGLRGAYTGADLIVYNAALQVDAGAPAVGQVSGLAFSPDDTQLLVMTDNDLLIYQINTWAVAATLTRPSYPVQGAVAWAPGMIAVATQYENKAFALFDPATGGALSGAPTPPAMDGTAVAFSADGAYLAVGLASSPYIQIYATSTWTALATQPSVGHVCSGLSWSPDGAYLAAARADSVDGLEVWETTSWTAVSAAPVLVDDYPAATAWSTDGTQLILACNSNDDDRGILVYQVSDWSQVAAYPKPSSGRHQNLAVADWLDYHHVSGEIRDHLGAPAARPVHLIDRASLTLLDSTISDAGDGGYSFLTFSAAECLVIAQDTSGDYNDLCARVLPA